MKTGPSKPSRSAVRKIKPQNTQEIFDNTMQKTQVWLNDLMQELDWEGKPHKAYLALRTVLHMLRDRLTPEEVVQLGAQLPMLVRGFYYEGWTLKDKPLRERHKEQFLDHVREAFRKDVMVNPQQIVRAVFRILQRNTSPGEIDDVKQLMPKPLRELWP